MFINFIHYSWLIKKVFKSFNESCILACVGYENCKVFVIILEAFYEKIT